MDIAVDKIRLRVIDIITETEEAKSFVLEAVDGVRLDYKAGQFLTLLIEMNGRPIRRSYSFSSDPASDPFPVITIKRVANGEVSRYLLDSLKAGDVLNVLSPAGRFVLEKPGMEENYYVFFAAGSGITPIFSLIKSLLSRKEADRIWLIYSANSAKSAIFFDALNALMALHPGVLRLRFLFSDPESQSLFSKTRLSNLLVEEIVDSLPGIDLNRAVFMLCGPPDYMRMVTFSLLFKKVRKDQIKVEYFEPGPTPKPMRIPGKRTDKLLELVMNDLTSVLSIPYGQTILTAAEANGIEIPYSCRAGRCSTCASKVLEGQIFMSVNEVLTDREVAEGMILTCVGYPVTEKVTVKIW